MPDTDSCETERPLPDPEDYELYVDPIGVSHWLPPMRCKNCED